MARSSWLIPFAVLAFTFVPASAQEPSDTFRLGEIVVTATRLPTPRGAVPAAVSILNGEDLRSRGIRFVADALREVPEPAWSELARTVGSLRSFCAAARATTYR